MIKLFALTWEGDVPEHRGTPPFPKGPHPLVFQLFFQLLTQFWGGHVVYIFNIQL